MPKKLCPTAVLQSVGEITPEWLEKNNVEAVVCDLDDTLVGHGENTASAAVGAWIESLENKKIPLLVLSNNKSKRRVSDFCGQHGIDFINRALKPLPFGAKKALRRLGIPAGRAVLVGDQVFTDVLCANLIGMKSVLVRPITLKKDVVNRLKRRLEEKYRV